MAKIESAFLDLSYLDRLATGTTVIHRLDPRVKVLIAALFVICVVSFDKYVVAAMLPFAVFLMIIMRLGEIPAGYVVNKLIVTSPFAVMVGMFNPFLDQQTVLQIGSWAISGGWVSFLSILLRFCLTVAAMLVLIATTGFNQVCMALERLGVPNIFAVQLLMLYRYIFVLLEEGQRMHRARALRSFQKRGLEMKQYAYLLGQLLLRTIDRGQRIHLAMLCRGFDGTIRIRRNLRITTRDIVVFLAGGLVLIAMRRFNIALLLGNFITDLLQ